MTYGNRNPQPTPARYERQPFLSVEFGDSETKYGTTIHQFTVRFAVAEFKNEPNVRSVSAIIHRLADAIDEAGYDLQARELREVADEFADERE